MHTIPEPALPRRSDEPTGMWPTLVVAMAATAGAIILGLASPASSTAALSAGRSAAAPVARDVSFVDRRCRA